MNTCPRCGSNYLGQGKVCGSCAGQPHSPSELRAVAAGPTLQTPERKPPPPSTPPSERDTHIPKPKPSAGAGTTGEIPARITGGGGAGADDTQEIDPLIGREPLGQYRILEKIGEGGFGAVYLADQLGVARKAVIKVLRKDLAGSQDFVKRFQREASVLAALDHHNLVRLFNFGTLPGGQLFLAMEYGGDKTLADEIRLNHRLSLERSLRIAEQVCLALHDAHARGVVHRDLKPANIMLGQKEGLDWVKVVDVGIAKILDSTEAATGQKARLTADGMIIGTPAYFSPEQARSLPIDGRSDVYSLGCVLYEMICGELPIAAKSPVDFVRAHCMDAPMLLRERGVEVPAPVQGLVSRALAKNPAERPTAKEMAALLGRERARLEGKRGARKRVALVAGAGVAAICLTLVVVRLFGREPTPPRATPPDALAVRPEPVTPSAAAPAPAVAATPAPAVAATPAPAAASTPPPAAAKAESTAPEPAAATQSEGKPKPEVTASRPKHARAKAAAADPWPARVAYIAQLSSARKYRAAIAEGEKALGQNPHPAARAALYKALGKASYDDGDEAAALRYLQLYRPYCLPDEIKPLNEQLNRLRADLGLPPAR
jgi:tRNA A-37 threonylcarbamoyl transferase component Bud32